MEETKKCDELTGLFLLKKCENSPSSTCNLCNKSMCETHAFTKNEKLICLSCFTENDTRLTKDIELYSKDRFVWRRKMINRFHLEYPYMTLIVDEHSHLFDTMSYGMIYHDYHDDSSYFDS